MTHALSSPDHWLTLHGDILYRYGISSVRDPQIAEDLVQETLLAALTAKANYSGKASEQTWLIGILKHKIIDYVRKSSREKTQEFDEFLINDEDYFVSVINSREPQNSPEIFLQSTVQGKAT